MLTNPGTLSLAKEIIVIFAIFVAASFPKLPMQEPKDPLNWIILDIWALLYKFYICLSIIRKKFLILVVCVAVKANW